VCRFVGLVCLVWGVQVSRAGVSCVECADLLGWCVLCGVCRFVGLVCLVWDVQVCWVGVSCV